MGKYTEILDQAAEGKKLFDAGKDMVEDAGDMEKVLGSEHLTNETKMSYVKDVVLKFKLTKFGKDADSFFEDTTEIIYSWMH